MCFEKKRNKLCKEFGAPNPIQDGLTRQMFAQILFEIDFNKRLFDKFGFNFYQWDKVSLFEKLEKLDSHKKCVEKFHKYLDQDKDGFLK